MAPNFSHPLSLLPPYCGNGLFSTQQPELPLLKRKSIMLIPSKLANGLHIATKTSRHFVISPSLALSFSPPSPPPIPSASAEPEPKWCHCRPLHLRYLLLETLLVVHLCMLAPSFHSAQMSPPQRSPLISLPKLLSLPQVTLPSYHAYFSTKFSSAPKVSYICKYICLFVLLFKALPKMM